MKTMQRYSRHKQPASFREKKRRKYFRTLWIEISALHNKARTTERPLL